MPVEGFAAARPPRSPGNPDVFLGTGSGRRGAIGPAEEQRLVRAARRSDRAAAGRLPGSLAGTVYRHGPGFCREPDGRPAGRTRA